MVWWEINHQSTPFQELSLVDVSKNFQVLFKELPFSDKRLLKDVIILIYDGERIFKVQDTSSWLQANDAQGWQIFSTIIVLKRFRKHSTDIRKNIGSVLKPATSNNM